jgi:hypothetical protein
MSCFVLVALVVYSSIYNLLMQQNILNLRQKSRRLHVKRQTFGGLNLFWDSIGEICSLIKFERCGTDLEAVWQFNKRVYGLSDGSN